MSEATPKRRKIPRIWRIYHFRDVLKLLITRDLKVRYSGAMMGYLWTIVEPLMLSLIFWFVFGLVFNGRDVGADPYILYLLSGMLSWIWTNTTIGDSTRALRNEAKLVRTVNIPREIWVLRIVGAKFVEFVLSLAVLAAFMIAYKRPPTLWILAVPVAMVVQFALLSGIGLLLAPLTVLFKDLERLIRILLRMFFYLTPVLYSVKKIPEAVQDIYILNPMVGILEIYRAVIFPELGMNYWALISSVIITVFVLVLGAYVFRNVENSALKEL